MGYQRPCDAPVTDSWWGHKNRNPPSSEPGTDYGCAYGTPLVAAEAGHISDAKSGNGSATGRYITLSLNDGRTVRYLHLSSLLVGIDTWVSRGQVIAYSGASANGSDWGVGAHVHTTLWPGAIWAAPTIDFEEYTDDDGNDDMTPEQADQLNNIYNAVFYGGPSMPDGNRSLGQSLADIATGNRPVVHRADSAGTPYDTSWIQELADVKTNQLAFQAAGAGQLVAPAWVAAGAVVLLVVLQIVATVAGSLG